MLRPAAGITAGGTGTGTGTDCCHASARSAENDELVEAADDGWLARVAKP